MEYVKNGVTYTKILTAPNCTSSLRWGNGKVLGYSKSNPDCFSKAGDIMYYVINIGSNVKSLDVTASFRMGDKIPSASVDYEDYAPVNNSWSEQWESSKYPDFICTITDGQENIIKQAKTNSAPAPEIIVPWVTLNIAQLNANYEGNTTTYVHVYRDDGKIPESIVGAVSYMGNGKAAVSFGSGASEIMELKATFSEEKKAYTCNGSSNKTYKISAHINYNCCMRDATEINFNNNLDVHYYTINMSYDCTPTDTITPACVMGELRNSDAKKIYGLGEKYEWDVKFKWYQQNQDQNDATNIKYHIPVCDCKSYNVPDGTDSEGNTIYRRVEVLTYDCCHCYCSKSSSGQNNGVSKWRNADMGLGLYYEYHDLRIKCWSSAHGERDISSGSTTVYTGEDFKFWFEALYVSNRDDLPESPYYPYEQPYETGNGGQGCFKCNILSRSPSVYNVEGPTTVRIQVSGTAGYNIDRIYNSPQYYYSNSKVNKHFKWTTFNGKIHSERTNVNQKIMLSISSYDFKGHYYDSYFSADGSGSDVGKKAYAWWDRDSHVFCGTRTATIYLRPSKTYLGSDVGSGSSGLDGEGVLSSGEGDAWVDGDTWVY